MKNSKASRENIAYGGRKEDVRNQYTCKRREQKDVLYPAMYLAASASETSFARPRITTPSSTVFSFQIEFPHRDTNGMCIRPRPRKDSERSPRRKRHTFVVCQDALRDLQNASMRNIARRGLDEEERLLWYGVVEFFGVGRIVPANGYDLFKRQHRP